MEQRVTALTEATSSLKSHAAQEGAGRAFQARRSNRTYISSGDGSHRIATSRKEVTRGRRVTGRVNKSSARHIRQFDVAALIRLSGEDEEIIHPVAFHEILSVTQNVSCFGGFANNNILAHPVISSVPIAINDANLRSWFQR